MTPTRETKYHRLQPPNNFEHEETLNDKTTACSSPIEPANDDMPWQNRNKWSSPSNKLLLAFSIILAIYATISTTLLLRPSPSQTTKTQRTHLSTLHCGNTSSEALSLNCKFDLLTYHWIPAECFDSTTAHEFAIWLNSSARNFGPWPFFKDIHGHSQVVTLEELSTRYDVMTYSTREEHLAHCVFMLRRLRRAADPGGALLSAPSMAHIEHCQEALVGGFTDAELLREGGARERGDKLGAIFKVRFGHCYEI